MLNTHPYHSGIVSYTLALDKNYFYHIYLMLTAQHFTFCFFLIAKSNTNTNTIT
tara:strand:+ start:29 stop:190 length:162 start_codon:yes stop_codon:yes gene_type:complete